MIRVVAHFVALGIVSDSDGNRLPILPPKPPAPLLDSDFLNGETGAFTVRVGDEAMEFAVTSPNWWTDCGSVRAVARSRTSPATPLDARPARPGPHPQPSSSVPRRQLVLSTKSQGRLLRGAL